MIGTQRTDINIGGKPHSNWLWLLYTVVRVVYRRTLKLKFEDDLFSPSCGFCRGTVAGFSPLSTAKGTCSHLITRKVHLLLIRMEVSGLDMAMPQTQAILPLRSYGNGWHGGAGNPATAPHPAWTRQRWRLPLSLGFLAVAKCKFSCWSKERRPHRWVHASKSHPSEHRHHLQMRYPGSEEALHLCPERSFESLALLPLAFNVLFIYLFACLFIYLFIWFFQIGFS